MGWLPKIKGWVYAEQFIAANRMIFYLAAAVIMYLTMSGLTKVSATTSANTLNLQEQTTLAIAQGVAVATLTASVADLMDAVNENYVELGVTITEIQNNQAIISLESEERHLTDQVSTLKLEIDGIKRDGGVPPRLYSQDISQHERRLGDIGTSLRRLRAASIR